MTKKIAHTEVDSKNEKTNPFCRASNLPSGQSRTLKNKKTTKRTHFPVRHLPMVSYREFSGFWYTKLLPFLLDFSHHNGYQLIILTSILHTFCFGGGGRS